MRHGGRHSPSSTLPLPARPMGVEGRTPASRRARGFTLIELLLVMLIIAICVGIAAPQMAGSTRARTLPGNATDFITLTRWCRVQALEHGTNYRLYLDTTEMKWWVTKADTTGTQYTPVSVDNSSEKDQMGREYKLPDGMAIQTDIQPDPNEGGVFIGFTPNGRNDVGTVTFSFQNMSLDVKCESPMGTYHIVEQGTQQ